MIRSRRGNKLIASSYLGFKSLLRSGEYLVLRYEDTLERICQDVIQSAEDFERVMVRSDASHFLGFFAITRQDFRVETRRAEKPEEWRVDEDETNFAQVSRPVERIVFFLIQSGQSADDWYRYRGEFSRS